MITEAHRESKIRMAEGSATKIIIPSNIKGVATFGTVLNEMLEKKDSKK